MTINFLNDLKKSIRLSINNNFIKKYNLDIENVVQRIMHGFYRVVRGNYKLCIDPEDYLTSIWLAVDKSTSDAVTNMNIKYPIQYVVSAVVNRMLDYNRKMNSKKHFALNHSIYKSINTSDESKIYEEENAIDFLLKEKVNKQFEKNKLLRDIKIWCSQIASECSDKAESSFVLHWINGYNKKDIANYCGISISRVNKLIDKYRFKILEEFNI